MHDILHTWAVAYGIPPYAVHDLLQRFGIGHEMAGNAAIQQGMSESAVLQRVRLGAADVGVLTWRNNVGALMDAEGRMVRFGLCNDTAALNKKIKSHDLIGIKPVLITHAMVGTTIGQFWSREVKEGGWHYTGTDREVAQLAWGTLITSRGGDAAFTTGAI